MCRSRAMVDDGWSLRGGRSDSLSIDGWLAANGGGDDDDGEGAAGHC